MFGKNTLERRRTVSTSSLNMNNATENVLRNQRLRDDKLKHLEKGKHPPTNTQNQNNIVQSGNTLPPYQIHDPSLAGPSKLPVKQAFSSPDEDDDTFKA